MMTIRINGETREVASGLTVQGLLAELGIDLRHVAVERNRELVPKDRFETETLQPDDALEIVTFVGGG